MSDSCSSSDSSFEESNEYDQNCNRIINHNHEFLSSTDYARDDNGDIHNHRIAGVTSPPIRYRESHIHIVEVLTDTFDDHFHVIRYTTGRAINLPGGKHIHLVRGVTSRNDGHQHNFYFTTLIENPSNVPEGRKC